MIVINGLPITDNLVKAVTELCPREGYVKCFDKFLTCEPAALSGVLANKKTINNEK